MSAPRLTWPRLDDPDDALVIYYRETPRRVIMIAKWEATRTEWRVYKTTRRKLETAVFPSDDAELLHTTTLLNDAKVWAEKKFWPADE